MRKSILFYVLLLLFSGLILTGCKIDKEEEDQGAFIVTVTLDGNPVQGANVEIFDEVNEISLDIKQTSSSGLVYFDNLDPGVYSFECDYEDAQNNFYTGSSDLIRLIPGATMKITIELHLDVNRSILY